MSKVQWSPTTRKSPSPKRTDVRARHCALGLFALAACGDRSPPALWPEPPPPTLAKPIGIDEPPDATEVATSTAGEEAGDEGKAGPATAPTSGGPPWLPEGRPPMPPLAP